MKKLTAVLVLLCVVGIVQADDAAIVKRLNEKGNDLQPAVRKDGTARILRLGVHRQGKPSPDHGSGRSKSPSAVIAALNCRSLTFPF